MLLKNTNRKPYKTQHNRKPMEEQKCEKIIEKDMSTNCHNISVSI